MGWIGGCWRPEPAGTPPGTRCCSIPACPAPGTAALPAAPGSRGITSNRPLKSASLSLQNKAETGGSASSGCEWLTLVNPLFIISCTERGGLSGIHRGEQLGGCGVCPGCVMLPLDHSVRALMRLPSSASLASPTEGDLWRSFFLHLGFFIGAQAAGT